MSRIEGFIPPNGWEMTVKDGNVTQEKYIGRNLYKIRWNESDHSIKLGVILSSGKQFTRGAIVGKGKTPEDLVLALIREGMATYKTLVDNGTTLPHGFIREHIDPYHVIRSPENMFGFFSVEAVELKTFSQEMLTALEVVLDFYNYFFLGLTCKEVKEEEYSFEEFFSRHREKNALKHLSENADFPTVKKEI